MAVILYFPGVTDMGLFSACPVPVTPFFYKIQTAFLHPLPRRSFPTTGIHDTPPVIFLQTN